MTDQMGSVDHSHLAQRAVAGAYRRGRHADAGLRADGSGEESETDDRERMRDVSHTPADGEGTNDVWSRGDDARPVVSDDDE
jgi:hypothetical protein